MLASSTQLQKMSFQKEREGLRNVKKWKMHAQSMQNYCFSLSIMRICDAFVAVVAVPFNSLFADFRNGGFFAIIALWLHSVLLRNYTKGRAEGSRLSVEFKVENKRFTVRCSRCRYKFHLVVLQATSKNVSVQNYVAHVQNDYFSLFNQSVHNPEGIVKNTIKVKIKF